MKKTTKNLTHDAALICAQNWRYFGYPFKIKKLSWDKYSVTAKDWVWSHIHLSENDFV